MKVSICILLVLVCHNYALGQISYAQYDTDDREINRDEVLAWVTIGLGGATTGIGGVAKAVTAWSSHSISGKMQLTGNLSWGGASVTSFQEFSLFYGTQRITPRSIGRIAAGPAYFAKNSVYRFGLGIEAEVIYTASPFGSGIMGSVTASPDAIYGVLTVNLSIGKLD